MTGYRIFARFVGLTVTVLIISIAWTGGKSLYSAFYGRATYVMVSPNGTAGLETGSKVLMDGAEIGMVTSNRTFDHASRENQKKALQVFREERSAMGHRKDSGSSDSQRYSPARMTFARMLITNPHVSIDQRTLAGGSTFYMTGKGYIMLSNRKKKKGRRTVRGIIPSRPRYTAFERLSRFGVGIGDVLGRTIRFQKTLDRWYHGRNQKPGGAVNSGKQQIENVSKTIDDMLARVTRVKNTIHRREADIEQVSSTIAQVDRIVSQLNNMYGPGSTEIFEQVSADTPRSRELPFRVHQIAHDVRTTMRDLNGVSRSLHNLFKGRLHRPFVGSLLE